MVDIVNIGTAEDDPNADTIREAFDKVNDVFATKGQPDGLAPLDGEGHLDNAFIHAAKLVPHLMPHLIPDAANTHIPVPGSDSVPLHRQPAATIDITVLGHLTNLDLLHTQQYAAEDIPKITAYTLGDLRAMPIGKTFAFPMGLTNMSPDGAPVHMIPVADTDAVNLSHHGLHLANAVLIRISERVWRVIAEEWTGTQHQPTVEWALDLDASHADTIHPGAEAGTAFTSLVWELEDEIGDHTALGAETMVHKTLELESKLHAALSRIASLEAAGVAQGMAGVTHTEHVNAVADVHLVLGSQGNTFMMMTDDPSAHAGIDLWDGAEHKVDFAWVADHATQRWYLAWAIGAPCSLWMSDGGSHFDHFADPTTGQSITFTAMNHWAELHSVLTIKFNSAERRMEMIRIEHGTEHAVTTHA